MDRAASPPRFVKVRDLGPCPIRTIERWVGPRTTIPVYKKQGAFSGRDGIHPGPLPQELTLAPTGEWELTLHPGAGCRMRSMDMNVGGFTVSQLARRAGVGVPTIRYYERRRLLPKPARRASGYRDYPADAVRRVRFIRHAQELGFSLREIAELLSLSMDPKGSCADVRTRAAGKVADIELKLASLGRMRAVLRDLMDACPGDGPTEDCPILRAMDDER